MVHVVAMSSAYKFYCIRVGDLIHAHFGKLTAARSNELPSSYVTLTRCMYPDADTGMEKLRGGLRRMWLTHPRMFTHDHYGHAKTAVEKKKLNGPSCRKQWRARVDSPVVAKYAFSCAQPASQPLKQAPGAQRSGGGQEISWAVVDVSSNLHKLLDQLQVCVHPAPLVKVTKDTYQLWYHCHRGGSQSTTAICEHRSLGCVARHRAPHPKRVGCAWRLKLVYPADQRPNSNPLNGTPLPARNAAVEQGKEEPGPSTTHQPIPRDVKVLLDNCHVGHIPGGHDDAAFFPVQEVSCFTTVFCSSCMGLPSCMLYDIHAWCGLGLQLCFNCNVVPPLQL